MKKPKNLLCRLSFLVALMCLPLWANAQGIVKGTIFDSTGEPIIGAAVQEKGLPSNGVATDFDGNFTLELKASTTAIVSYVGMISQEIQASEANQQIVLKDDNANLEDVVVIGYTSRARKDLTGSVGSISGARLAQVPVTSAAVALQGKISGVQVTTIDGQPGADVNIRVRGGSSITQSNEPLYIVDGFQVDNINDIPPTDILSIDILKDASLTAIYGSKGGNGVVVVTTKSAQEGKLSVSFNGQLSVSHLSKELDLMNARQFAEYQYQWHSMNGTRSSNGKYYRANFGNPYDLDMYDRLPSHDWQDEVMGETPVSYSANVTIGGGSEKVRFNASLTQSNDDGIIMGSGVRRTNMNIKTNVKINDKLSLQINPKFTYRRDEGAGGSHVGTGGIIDVLKYRPTNGLREYGYVDPSYADPLEEKTFEYKNPKSDIKINSLVQHAYTSTNALALEWKPIDGLTLRTEATIGMRWYDKSRFYGALTKEGEKHHNQPVAELSDHYRLNYVWTNTAAYNFTVKDDHNWSFLVGQEIYHRQQREIFTKNIYFPENFSSEEAWNNMAFGEAYESTSKLSTADRTASFFGQANYNWKHRYLLSATFRADGSTKFAPGNQWGYFPSISGAWVISEEPWFEADWVNQLKIRAAFGLTGNNRVSDDLWRPLYVITSTGGPGFGENTQYGEKHYLNTSGGKEDKLANRDIKWETIVTRNLAADIQLFDGRVTITPEIYWNTTRDMLYDANINPTLGYNTQLQNVGQVTNRGLELSITGDILRGTDYVLTGHLAFGTNKMKVDKLNGEIRELDIKGDDWDSGLFDYRLREGEEVGLIYGYVYDGLYGFDEFYFDPMNNYQAVPWGSLAADNGTSKNQAPREDGYVTVINEVLDDSNSGKATLPGKVKFKDLNGDGRITKDDRTVIGKTTPKVQGGFGLSGQWKNFDFVTNFTYMLDYDINNATSFTLSSSEGNKENFYNVLSKFSNGWLYNDISGELTGTPGDILYKLYYVEGGTEIYKAANANRTLWNPADVPGKITHSYFIEDGSFLRCNDITVGYTIPENVTKKWGISKARFYASATNLFILTNYSGYDPEVDIQTGLTPCIDYNRYPRNRSFVFGTNITF